MDGRGSLRLKVLSLLLFLAAAACLGGGLYLLAGTGRCGAGSNPIAGCPRPGHGEGGCSNEDEAEEGDDEERKEKTEERHGGGGGAHHNGNCQQQQQQQQQGGGPGPGGDRGGSVQSPAGAMSRDDDDDNEDDDDGYPEAVEAVAHGAIALLVASAALGAGSIAALVLGCRAQRRLPAVGLAVGLAGDGQGKEASAPNVYVVTEAPALDEKQWSLPPAAAAAAAAEVVGPWALPVALPSYSEACGVPEGAGRAAP